MSWNIHKKYFIEPIGFYANDFAQLEIDFYLNCFLLNIERFKLNFYRILRCYILASLNQGDCLLSARDSNRTKFRQVHFHDTLRLNKWILIWHDGKWRLPVICVHGMICLLYTRRCKMKNKVSHMILLCCLMIIHIIHIFCAMQLFNFTKTEQRR